jgi:GST-like protein
MIDLYGMSSPNVLKVTILLEELALPYRFHYVNVAGGEQFEPEFVALNPNSRVPVIVDEDGPDGEPYTVFESGAILFYLAEKTRQFLPADVRGRHDTVQWLMIQMGNVGPMFGQLNHFQMYAPPGNEYSLSRYRTASGRLYDMLDRRLAEVPYLTGEDYTIADMATYPWAALYHEKHGEDWDQHPALRQWAERIGARPAVARAEAQYEGRQADDPSQHNHSQDGLDRVFGWGKYARG